MTQRQAAAAADASAAAIRKAAAEASAGVQAVQRRLDEMQQVTSSRLDHLNEQLDASAARLPASRACPRRSRLQQELQRTKAQLLSDVQAALVTMEQRVKEGAGHISPSQGHVQAAAPILVWQALARVDAADAVSARDCTESTAPCCAAAATC